MPGRLLAELGTSRPLAEVSGEELVGLREQLWGRPGDLEPQPRGHGTRDW